MSDVILSPNMNMPVPIPGQAPGPDWADDYNACLTITDQHNHSPGSGVPISQDAINLTADPTTFDSLGFNTSNAYSLRSIRFVDQASALGLATDLACIYFAGGEFWANDSSGNQVQLTAGGVVNATSSGISSGTATCSFVASVLVVNRAAATPANVQCASVLLGNNVASSKYLTLQPPNSMAADFSLTLPSIPGATKIMALDTSGNMTGAYTVDNSTITIAANVIGVPAGGITTMEIASATIVGGNVASDIDLPGKSVTADGQNVLVSANPASGNGYLMVHGPVASGGGTPSGCGFSSVRNSAGHYTITFDVAYTSIPHIYLTAAQTVAGRIQDLAVDGTNNGTIVQVTQMNAGGGFADGNFFFMAIGQRA